MFLLPIYISALSLLYCNLQEVQLQILRTMTGLEQVEIVRPGYDVEYDYVQPTSLRSTLETKQITGLYLAGQVNTLN